MAVVSSSDNRLVKTLLLSLALLLLLSSGVDAQSSSGLSGEGEEEGDPCLQLFDTHDQGVYVCHDHRDLLNALEAAEMMGRDQCEKAFAGEKWNCSGFSILKAPNITSLATKEAAYVQALSLAAIAHSVAKMCAMGKSCICTSDSSPPELSTGNEERRHYTPDCSDNVSFGVSFATQFLKLRLALISEEDEKNEEEEEENMEEEKEVEEEEDVATKVFMHNLRTAAQVANASIMKTPPCRCVGVSGTCTILSCQKYSFSDFSTIAKEILDIYKHHTCRYSLQPEGEENGEAEEEEESSGQEQDRNRNRTMFETNLESYRIHLESALQKRPMCRGTPDTNHFVYVEDSPNYCIANPSVGSLGTRGRECDPHSTTGANSCQKLCTTCGWSHTNVTQLVEKNCYCSFIYCCEIKCHKCLKPRIAYQCV